MTRRMTKTEAKAWKKRWELVNAAERKELREASMELRLKQLTTLMAWAVELKWTDALAEGETEVRDRWNRLRKAYGV